jgi:xanthosine utilization system XapX-like protein
LGDTPPLIRAYIDQMAEMRPFWEAWQRDHIACDGLIAPGLAALAAPVLLATGNRGRRPEWLLLTALLYLALGLGLLHIRLLSYANWFAIPIVAAAVAEAAGLWRRLLAPTVLITALISPAPGTAAIVGLAGLGARPAPAVEGVLQGVPLAAPASTAKCADHSAYPRLRALPRSLVLADPDLGAFILAETPHAVLAGPYHRLVPGLTQTFRLFSEPVEAARRDLGALHVAFVVDCPDEANKADHAMIGAGGLLGALDRRAPPVWLRPLSPPGERLQVYAVQP